MNSGSKALPQRIPAQAAIVVLSFLCLVVITHRPPLESLPSPWEFRGDNIQYFGDGPQFRLNKQVEAAGNAAARKKASEL